MLLLLLFIIVNIPSPHLLVLVEVLVAPLQQVELGVVELGVAVLVGVSVKLPQEPTPTT